MEHYVTLFDSAFLPQGMALHDSLERHVGDYTLWILCVDDEACRVLGKLGLPNVRLLDLADLETGQLRKLKQDRSGMEYCWTLTPFAVRFALDADPGIERVTYLDADIWFLKSPDPIFREFEASGKDVLITDHAYAPEYDQSATSGQYCVQFLTFTRRGGEAVRKDWEERCVEWCHDRYEGKRFGDQKYLDDWPEKFPDRVHVLRRCEWTLAPWNATRFPYGTAIFYHFQGLRLVGPAKVSLGRYPLPEVLVRNVYEPYLLVLKKAMAKLREAGFEPRIQQNRPGLLRSVKYAIEGIRRQSWRFNTRHYRKI